MMRHLFKKYRNGSGVSLCGKTSRNIEHFAILPLASDCPDCWLEAKDIVMKELELIYFERAQEVFDKFTWTKKRAVTELIRSGLSTKEANVSLNAMGTLEALAYRRNQLLQNITDILVATVLTPAHETDVATVLADPEPVITVPESRTVSSPGAITNAQPTISESNHRCHFCNALIEFKEVRRGVVKGILHLIWACTCHNSHELVVIEKTRRAYWWGNGMSRVHYVEPEPWMCI